MSEHISVLVIVIVLAVIIGFIWLLTRKPKYKRPVKRHPKFNPEMDKKEERRFRRDHWH